MLTELGPFEAILLAELRLGLPPVFYGRLHEVKDDWSFILKLHALFEGTLAKLTAEKLAARNLRHESITPYDSCFSRIRLAGKLRLIVPEHRNYLLSLNHLRNHVTHNIQFINMRLPNYFDSLCQHDFRRVSRDLAFRFQNVSLDAPVCSKVVSSTIISSALRKRAQRHSLQTIRELFMCLCPKTVIWISGIDVLHSFSLHFHHEIIEGKIQQERDVEAKLQDLLLDPAVIAFKKEWEAIRDEFEGI